MKTNNQLIVILLSFAALACSGGKSEHHEGASEGWPEMDAFHMRMAEVFHPYKDSANLAPAREMADLLADEADKWATSKFPGKADNDATKTALKKLREETTSFAALAKADTPDDVLGKKLTALHETFHGIVEKVH